MRKIGMNLKVPQGRQKNHTYKRRTQGEFGVGDYVYVKVRQCNLTLLNLEGFHLVKFFPFIL